jgi:hypothetical protein
METLRRSLDWSTTAVGAVETWLQSLKTAICLIRKQKPFSLSSNIQANEEWYC